LPKMRLELKNPYIRPPDFEVTSHGILVVLISELESIKK